MKLIVLIAAAALSLASASSAGAEPRLSIVTGAGGVSLLVAEAGDPAKPSILFIHGFAQSYLSFRRQFESDLAKRYHLVAFDLRGQGGSGKPEDAAAYADSKVWADDVAAVIKATHLNKPVLVGWSYGGFVVSDYVRHYGAGHIAGVNMVGSMGGLAGFPPPVPGGEVAAAAMKAKSERARGLDLLANVEAGKQTATDYETANMTKEDKDVLFATEMMMPAYVRRLMKQRKLINLDIVDRFTAPVLFSRGSRDTTMPAEPLAKLIHELPKARLSAYDDTGHLTFVERPERFNSELAAFAESVGAQ